MLSDSAIKKSENADGIVADSERTSFGQEGKAKLPWGVAMMWLKAGGKVDR